MEVVIVGSGVSGLSCGVRLREAGYNTRIVTREAAADTTSVVAGAVWYPYKAYPEDRVLEWGRRTLDELVRLAEVPDTGVSMLTFVELFERTVPDPWWREAVPGFRRAWVDELLPGYVDGFALDAPLIEAPVHLRYLEDRFRALGGSIRVESDGVTNLAELEREGRLIVNCTGLGARTLVDDLRVYPIRGQVVRVENPGLGRGLLDQQDPRSLTYIIPRAGDCVLGGTAEEHAWHLEPDPETSNRILERCIRLEPRLRDARVLGSSVGLRPARDEVRLEIEEVSPGCAVIHNYGHGGSGFTLSWGCAGEVLELARAVG